MLIHVYFVNERSFGFGFVLGVTVNSDGITCGFANEHVASVSIAKMYGRDKLKIVLKMKITVE